MLTISFTGHRPNKLGGYDYSSGVNVKIMEILKSKLIDIVTLSREKDIHFIVGGALGLDQMAYIICSQLKQELNTCNISIEVAVPFKNQSCKWIESSKQLYQKQLDIADKVTYVDTLDSYKIKGYSEDIYYPAKMQKRNMYMVDNADFIISIWDGSNGGTKNCVMYTKSLNKKVLNLNPNTYEWKVC